VTEPTGRTDWVIVGSTQEDGGVQVIASRSIDPMRSGLTVKSGHPYDGRSEYYDPWSWDRLSRTPEYTLTIGLRQFVIIVAPTCEEALRKLFTQWTPAAAEQPALEPATKEVTS